MKHVKFVKHHGGYNAGEVASFQDDLAAKLITRKVAVEHDGKFKKPAEGAAASTDAKTGDAKK